MGNQIVWYATISRRAASIPTEHLTSNSDWMIPYIHALIKFNVPDLKAPIETVVQHLIVDELSLEQDLYRLPKLWTWLLNGNQSPLEAPRIQKTGLVRIDNGRLEEICRQQGFRDVPLGSPEQKKRDTVATVTFESQSTKPEVKDATAVGKALTQRKRRQKRAKFYAYILKSDGSLSRRLQHSSPNPPKKASTTRAPCQGSGSLGRAPQQSQPVRGTSATSPSHFLLKSTLPASALPFKTLSPLQKNLHCKPTRVKKIPRIMTDKKKPRKVAAGTVPPTLPPTVEKAYREKCIELKRRLAEVEQSNDSFRLRKNRLLRGIRKMRLERTILLETLGKRMRKNGVNGYYDTDSEGSSDGPPTVPYHPHDPIDTEASPADGRQPHDKPLRSKRSHRRAMGSPPPILAHQLSGPNAQLSQQPLPAFQTPYAPRHELSFQGSHAPNGISHLQPQLARAGPFPINNLYPSPDSQIPLPSSAYHFFLETQFLGIDDVRLQYTNMDDLYAAARKAWERMSAAQADQWLGAYEDRLRKWRLDMDILARQSGEAPRGEVRIGGPDYDTVEQEAAEREEEVERQRDEEMAERAEQGVRVASGGFTSING